MKESTNNKVLINSLILEKVVKLSREERKEVILKLLLNNSQQKVADILGVSKSTIFDWKIARDYSNENKQISLNLILLKLKHLDAIQITDWGRIEQIKEVVDELLREKWKLKS